MTFLELSHVLPSLLIDYEAQAPSVFSHECSEGVEQNQEALSARFEAMECLAVCSQTDLIWNKTLYRGPCPKYFLLASSDEAFSRQHGWASPPGDPLLAAGGPRDLSALVASNVYPVPSLGVGYDGHLST